ncbi:MAG TPA: hydroxymethylglutaryl-CoA reductase [Cytophagales bacterium]|jgi:hydroxymethylglutaryl-CoA reductase (NADPH)|nr:hydroxymethylglutaryl-CoA reductase [Cytophagales bacterium]
MFVPQLILRQLYNRGSLHNTSEGVCFSIKNRLKDVQLLEITEVGINNEKMDPDNIIIELSNGYRTSPKEITHHRPVNFDLREVLKVICKIEHLSKEKHQLKLKFEVKDFGSLELKVEDSITPEDDHLLRIPRDISNDYSDEIIKKRQEFLEEQTKERYKNLFFYNIDPKETNGNIEHFTGVIQVPFGLAGPITINGEHAHGDFLVPMATTEGTLVASYNRGIKLLNVNGGARVTVVEDSMQRAPVFIFENAREAKAFVQWVNNNLEKIRGEAEATSSIAKLQYIDSFLSNKFAYLRFNYSTGDAAGQNMVGRATFYACSWILDHYKPEAIKNFYLESNLATDKKASQINVMRSRGKRVIAEAVISRDSLIQYMRVEPEKLDYHQKVSNVGAFISGANNNGAHSPNAITAIFIATGQDVANVSESSAAILYTEMTPEKDLYISITIPSLIVATYGGGTALPSQRECLKIMGCYGKDKVYKLAEIIGGVVLAGELSLGSAISSSDWVSSHEHFGRNR